MRTTLTIDNDLAGIAQRRARELGKPFKEIINRALRKGLAMEGTDPVQGRNEVKTRPHSFGFKPGIDLDKLNQLTDELEVEEFAKRHLRERP